MITKEIYDLFCLHGSELLWIDDPLRINRPKATSKETDEMFVILEKIDEHLGLFYNDNYNDELKKYSDNIIKKYKKVIDPEVFEIMKSRYQK